MEVRHPAAQIIIMSEPDQIHRSVELVKAGASKGLVLKVDKPEAKVDSLDDGSYEWSVRALARDGSRSERSERRSLQLVPNTLKINVKTTTWK